MTRREKLRYRPTTELREVFIKLYGQKFVLDCGHHVTFGHFLGNDIVITAGKHPEIHCSLCWY